MLREGVEFKPFRELPVPYIGRIHDSDSLNLFSKCISDLCTICMKDFSIKSHCFQPDCFVVKFEDSVTVNGFSSSKRLIILANYQV